MVEVEFRGYRILLGKNAENNDELISAASDDDYWLHLSEYPSPHCIICNPSGKRIHSKVIQHAAYLTKKYSKYARVDKVSVDVTRIKFVQMTEKKGLVRVINIIKTLCV